MKSALRPSTSLVPAVTAILVLGIAATAMAQMRPQTRSHTILQSDGSLDRQPATALPPGTSSFTMQVVGDERIISANGIPDHHVGAFPSSGNPNRISAQRYEFVLDATPAKASRTTPARGIPFGIAVSGVVFDPGAAEWYKGQRGPWQYEPLSGAVKLGVDANNAHVQPTGAYHYHGLPTGLMTRLAVGSASHSAIVGWAADGFPIYAKYGYGNPEDPTSPIIEHRSSYTLKEGLRQPQAANPRGPGGGRQGTVETPGGYYDGTFIADYAYAEGHGTLDECNGTFAVTPDFPDGTYAYFLTADWPVIPRCFAGTPAESFTSMRPGPQSGPGGRGGPGGNRGSRPDGPPNGDRFGQPPQRF